MNKRWSSERKIEVVGEVVELANSVVRRASNKYADEWLRLALAVQERVKFIKDDGKDYEALPKPWAGSRQPVNGARRKGGFYASTKGSRLSV